MYTLVFVTCSEYGLEIWRQPWICTPYQNFNYSKFAGRNYSDSATKVFHGVACKPLSSQYGHIYEYDDIVCELIGQLLYEWASLA